MDTENFCGVDDRRNGQEALIRVIADKAAHAAVAETLTALGIDPNDPREAQKDFAWVRSYRELSEKIGSRILLTTITLLTAGIAGLVWKSVEK